MPYPIKICSICSEEFELKPDKPGFANRCPECSENDEVELGPRQADDAFEDKAAVNAARRKVMREMLYSKDS
jgi:hypothetical protein